MYNVQRFLTLELNLQVEDRLYSVTRLWANISWKSKNLYDS